VDVSGKPVAEGEATNRLSGWIRSGTARCYGYAIIWEAKEDRSELVTFFRLKSKRSYEKHAEKRRAEAREIKGMK